MLPTTVYRPLIRQMAEKTMENIWHEKCSIPLKPLPEKGPERRRCGKGALEHKQTKTQIRSHREARLTQS